MDGPGNSKGSALLAVYWTQFAIALSFVSLRVYARCLIHALGWDDFFMLLAMVGCEEANVFIGTV